MRLIAVDLKVIKEGKSFDEVREREIEIFGKNFYPVIFNMQFS